MTKQELHFIPNRAVETARHMFVDINVNTAKILQSWRESLFSFEWLDDQGKIKSIDDLSVRERPKRVAVEQLLKKDEPLEKPILGLGLSDHVEIGSGRATFLTLADLGHETIPVHIPKANESDFQAFLADIN